MHYKLPPILAIATLASASPLRTTSDASTLTPRYTYSTTGNLNILCKLPLLCYPRHTFLLELSLILYKVSDTTVSIGTLSVSDVLGTLSAACGSSGLCELTPSAVQSKYLTSETTYQVDDIQLTPGGDYQVWIRDGLLEALTAAIEAVAVCTKHTFYPNCSGSKGLGNCPCESSTLPWILTRWYWPICLADPEELTKCVVPQFWGITAQSATQTNDAPSYMNVGITSANEVGTGFCSTFMTIGGAIAGRHFFQVYWTEGILTYF